MLHGTTVKMSSVLFESL